MASGPPGAGLRYHQCNLRRLSSHIGEFTPASQRGAALSICGTIYALGVSSRHLTPFVIGSVIGRAATQFMTGFKIKAAILIASGMLGLLLLWPEADKERVFRVAT